jgi:hypothetical protein
MISGMKNRYKYKYRYTINLKPLHPGQQWELKPENHSRVKEEGAVFL